jgi:uncharacterized protein (TIGR02391 family)
VTVSYVVAPIMPEDNVVIPIDTLLGMEPEELGARLLMVIRQMSSSMNRDGQAHRSNHQAAILSSLIGPPPYPQREEPEIAQAYTEAWAWLESQGLLVPSPHPMNPNFRVVSRRAKRFSELQDFVPYEIARRLDRDMLNPRIREEVWAAFIRGHFDVAAGVAMKAVEVAVRDACGYGDEVYGQTLIGRAFHPDSGPLTNVESVDSERKAMRDLFLGAIGTHKNAHSHRKVNLDNAAEVVEVVMLANHLLRVVDRRLASIRRVSNSSTPGAA